MMFFKERNILVVRKLDLVVLDPTSKKMLLLSKFYITLPIQLWKPKCFTQ